MSSLAQVRLHGDALDGTAAEAAASRSLERRIPLAPSRSFVQLMPSVARARALALDEASEVRACPSLSRC